MVARVIGTVLVLPECAVLPQLFAADEVQESRTGRELNEALRDHSVPEM